MTNLTLPDDRLLWTQPVRVTTLPTEAPIRSTVVSTPRFYVRGRGSQAPLATPVRFDLPELRANIRWVKALLAPVDYLAFLVRCLAGSPDLRRTGPRLVAQLSTHGVGALPVVILASVFIGLTTAVQTSYQLMGVVPKYFVGMGVGRLVLIELAPVFAGFIVAGRSASAMAAEIGAMRVSEQIDALEVMGVDPYRYLCLPRMLATMVGLPVLVAVTELVAVFTALVISSTLLQIPASVFTYGVTHFFMVRDFTGGLVKAFVFGLLIGGSGCYYGFHVSGGAEAVGKATTRAVVLSAVLILLVDFLMALIFFKT
jgi:phospholipid/cholesterol/gamma-HCH transport system permease protein